MLLVRTQTIEKKNREFYPLGIFSMSYKVK